MGRRPNPHIPGLSDALRWLRHRAQLTQAQLAELSQQQGDGFSEVYYSEVERSRNPKSPSPDMLARILTALGSNERELQRLLTEKPWERQGTWQGKSKPGVRSGLKSKGYYTALGSTDSDLTTPATATPPALQEFFESMAAHQEGAVESSPAEPTPAPEPGLRMRARSASRMMRSAAPSPSPSHRLKADTSSMSSSSALPASEPPLAASFNLAGALPAAALPAPPQSPGTTTPTQPELAELAEIYRSISRQDKLTLLGFARSLRRGG